MESLSLEQRVAIIFIGAVVAIIARRLKIPYTAGLVVAGIALALLPLHIDLTFSKELVFNVLLPPLIFEAALYLNWDELRRDVSVISVYATLGIVFSAVVTTALMHIAAGWPWLDAAFFGVLIAATDPVSIVATFKESKVKGRLRLLVEAESLFNDATVAVGFVLVVAFAAGESLGVVSSIWKLFVVGGGGILCGAVTAILALLIIGKTKDRLVELSITTVLAFASFWLAEHFHMSGILATTTAGLLVGNVTIFGRITEKGERSMEHFWEFAAFVANSVVFIILGISLASQDFASASIAIVVAIIAVVAGRAAAVYLCSALFSRTNLAVDTNIQHILFWGGLRGALAIALALGIPESVPHRQEILTVTFGVVAFSVFVQGLTVTPLLRRLQLIPAEANSEDD